MKFPKLGRLTTMYAKAVLLSRAARMKSWGAALALVSTVAMALLGPIGDARAYFCSEPSEPYCVDGSGYFDDQYEFDRCKSEVESYVSDVETYSQCLATQRNQAIEKANEVVEKFNCRAEGRSYC